jgi:hypothetical protein
MDEFIKFLQSSPEMLKQFLKIIDAWWNLQSKMPSSGGGSGPQSWVAGQTPTLTTVGLTQDEIDSFVKGAAEAHVKEKAITYIKGFLTGVSITL